MENFYEKTEGYLLGELNAEELAAFELALQQDPGLVTYVHRHRELLQRLDAMRLRDKVKAATAQATRSGAPGGRQALILLIVSALVLTALIWYFQATVPSASTQDAPIDTRQSPSNPIDTAQTPYKDAPVPQQEKKATTNLQLIAMVSTFQEVPSASFVRDASTVEDTSETKTEVQQAAEAFFRMDYKAAANLLKNDQSVLQDEAARYLRANARFKLGQFTAAAVDFEALTQSFQFKHESRFNLLLCQIALGNSRDAKQRLSAMENEPFYPFRNKAMALKQKLNW